MPRSLLNKFIVVVALAILLFLQIKGDDMKRGLGGDSLGYYMFLPSTFIYHNNKSLEKLPTDKSIPQKTIRDAAGMKQSKTPLGYSQDPYTLGVAIMEMPFFFIAHAWEKIKGTDANGYSDVYVYLLFLCDFFYALIGLIFTYLILIRYFSETLSLLSVIILLFGTNLLWFIIAQAGMSHVPLFCLYAILIYSTIRMHEKPATLMFIVAGFIAGMITLIRPSDIICLLIPLLYSVTNRLTLLQKLTFIKLHPGKTILAAVMFFLPIIPQLIYWKIMTGQFIYYSYGSQKFNWTDPKVFEGLFSAHNGWLVYSPVMIFSVFGLFQYKEIRPWLACILVIFPIYVYVVYSWYCYTYINGFGSRPMIHLYPLLALPLAASLRFISSQKILIKIFPVLFFIFLASAGFSYTLQQGYKLLISEASNYPYNMQILFHNKLTYNDLVAFDLGEIQPEKDKISKVATVACEYVEDSLAISYELDTASQRRFACHIKDEEYSPKMLSVKYDSKVFGASKYIRCSGWFMYPKLGEYTSHYLVLTIENIKWCACKIENKVFASQSNCPQEDIYLTNVHNGKWGYVWFYIRIPDNIPEGNIISLYVWNPGQFDLYFDDICMELYK